MSKKSVFDLLKEERSLKELEQLSTTDVSIVNESGQSPLHLAVLNNQIEKVAVLLNLGLSPNQKDNNELSAFIASAANGFDDVFELLLLSQPELTQVNRFGGTALLPSSEKGHIRVVQQALEAGVPVNHQNRLGWTALLEAVILGNEGFLYRDLVELLIRYGADALILDFDGKTAVDYAKEKNNQMIVDLLTNQSSSSAFTSIKEEIWQGHYYLAIKKLLAMEDTSEKLYYLGFSYEGLRQYKVANYYYEEGFKLDNQFAYYLANLAKKRNDKQMALSYFKKGSEVDRDQAFFDYHLSNYLRELGEHESAVSVMARLLVKDGNRVDYMFHQANSLIALGRKIEAYEVMKRANQKQPENKLFEEIVMNYDREN